MGVWASWRQERMWFEVRYGWFTFRSYADLSLVFAQFTTPNSLPFHTRLMWYLRRSTLSLLGYPVPCRHMSRQFVRTLKTGYLVIDYIEETHGRMLSESWEELRHDKNRRLNLFSDLSRIILSLAQLPLPRIGSLTIDKHGVLCLLNRPLTLRLSTSRERGNCNKHR